MDFAFWQSGNGWLAYGTPPPNCRSIVSFKGPEYRSRATRKPSKVTAPESLMSQV